MIAFFTDPRNLLSVGVALAQAAPDFGGTDSKVTGFLQNINGLLNLASIAVVTIAVIFAGYQIAFAHKRISDVAPILIGGFLIGVTEAATDTSFEAMKVRSETGIGASGASGH